MKYVKLVEETLEEVNTAKVRKGIEAYLTKDLKGKGVWKNELSDDELPVISKLEKQGKLSSSYNEKKDDYLLKLK